VLHLAINKATSVIESAISKTQDCII
jgi:hypothetical protein